MKKLLLFFVLLLFTQSAFAVAIERVTSNSVRFYNWSQSNFSMVGMFLTINNDVFHIDSLNIKKSGPLDVAPGDRIEFDGLTIPSTASIALWYPTAFPSNQNAGNIASFIQFGAAGQSYESIADLAGLWTAGTFVPGTPPFIRDENYVTWGAAHWSQGLSEYEEQFHATIKLFPNPFSNKITLSYLGEQIKYAQIVDATGRQYLHVNGNNKEDLEISTITLKKGIYLFRFQTESGEIVTKRLLKI